MEKENPWKKTYNKKEEEKQNIRSKTAVALSYDIEEEAPKIIASGKGVLAEKIVNKAEEENIPVHKDSTLANTLSKLQIGDYIPQELYEVVAEILVFVDKMDKIKGKLKEDRYS